MHHAASRHYMLSLNQSFDGDNSLSRYIMHVHRIKECLVRAWTFELYSFEYYLTCVVIKLSELGWWVCHSVKFEPSFCLWSVNIREVFVYYTYSV
jgi:hypothetical protein